MGVLEQQLSIRLQDSLDQEWEALCRHPHCPCGVHPQALHPPAPQGQPATAKNKCKSRKSESRGKGAEHFPAVCAVPASVFVSGFLCDWRFVYTTTGGFPTRLFEISGVSDFESKQTNCAVLYLCKRYFLVAGVRCCSQGVLLNSFHVLSQTLYC